MKRLFTIVAIATALTLSWSCQKEETPGKEDNKENTENQGGENQGGENQGAGVAEITATLQNTTVKTAWAEGDAILVYAVTEEGDVKAKYVLSSGAGEATGKFTATGQELPAGATGYFASYPYNDNLTFAQHNTFAFAMEAEQKVDVPVFAYATDAANLTFSSPVGAVKLSLAGRGGIAKIELSDKDSKNILNGNVSYNPAKGKFDIKNSAASKNMVTKVLAEKVELGETPVDFVLEVPAGAYATGATMVLFDVNNSPLANVEFPAITVEAGKVTALETQTIEPVAQTVNLNNVQGYANTYQLAAVGKYKFAAVKGNDKSAKLDAVEAELTWETWCNNEPVTPNSLVKAVTVEDGYVVVETADEYHAGNALVSVKDASGTIVWSWMLWFVEGTIGTIDVDGYVVMDRNLGALSTDPTKPGLNYGLLWQWGRSVPVMGFDGGRDSENPKAMTTAPVYESEYVSYEDLGLEKGAGIEVEYVIANPTKFFYSGNRQWAPNPHDEAAQYLWNTVKTIYDPCPAGYQVISTDTASAIFSGIDESVENDPTNFGFNLNGNWYPYTGWWKYSGGSRRGEGKEAYFWTTGTKLRSEEDGYNVATHYQVVEGAGKTSYESKGDALTIRCEVVSAI